MIVWKDVLKELHAFAQGYISLHKLSDLTVDTLYSSMYGLNHRYTPLQKVLTDRVVFKVILWYSIKRIEKLIGKSPVAFRWKLLPNTRQIGFGTYGWKYNHQLIKYSIQKGLLIDTAEGYGFGRVENELGIAFKNIKQTPYVTTKVSRSHMSPKAIVSAARRSQKKLGITPHYQLHFPHYQYSDEEIGRTLVHLREAKVILSIGLGNCSIDMIESMQAFLSDYSGDIIRTVQVKYNLTNRRIEKTIIPYCQDRGMAIIVYSPLGQKFSKLKKPILETIGKRNKCTAAQIALAWILRHRGVIPIPRTNNINHLKDNINATKIKLCKTDIQQLNEAYPYDKISNGLL